MDFRFAPRRKVKIQGPGDIINYQPPGYEIIELESKRTWLTDVFNFVYFNTFVQREFSKYFMKRVIVNGLTGSSWGFKRFERLSVIVTTAGCFKANDLNENFGDDDEQRFSPQKDNFIDDDSVQEEDESPTFYKFVDQTQNLDEAINDGDQSHLDIRASRNVYS